MMPAKRNAQDSSESEAGAGLPASAPTPAKRPRKSVDGTTSASRTLESLLALSHEELAKYALDLQTQLSALQQNGGGSGSGEAWSEEKIAERVNKTRDVCAAEIKKQMKWQPSCKTGTTKWSYTAMVPHEDVFYRLFGFEKPKKAWKQKKIDMADFEKSIGEITNSARYNYLRITGNEVKVHWDQEEKTYKLTGTYGL